MGRRAEHETHIGLLQGQRRDDLRRVQRLHRDGYCRILEAKALDRLRQNFMAQRHDGQNTQLPAVAAGFGVASQTLNFIELGKQPLDRWVRDQRFRGCAQAVPAALQQCKVRLQFGMLQQPVDGRMGHIDQPRRDPRQRLWGLRFLAACNASTSHGTTLALLALAVESLTAFDPMMATEKLDCDFSAAGKLVIHPNTAAFAPACWQMKLQQAMGSQQQAVDTNARVDIKPALAHYQRHIAGAIHTPGECAADCQKVCNGLVAVLQARGVAFLLGTAIDRLVVENSRVAAVATAQGDVEADVYVVALGAASVPLGVVLPVCPLKGYSITVEVSAKAHGAPAISVTDSACKMVFARIGSRLRVAGMAEIGGSDLCVGERQIASLEASTRRLFPDCSDFAELAHWAGRPT